MEISRRTLFIGSVALLAPLPALAAEPSVWCSDDGEKTWMPFNADTPDLAMNGTRVIQWFKKPPVMGSSLR